MTRRLLTARDVREITGLSRSSAYELMHILGCFRVLGRATRLPKDRLDKYLRNLERLSGPAPTRGTATTSTTSKPIDEDVGAEPKALKATARSGSGALRSSAPTKSPNRMRLERYAAEARALHRAKPNR